MSMTATSSDQLNASAAIAARPGRVHAVMLTPAAADASIIIYDNPSAASGKILARVDAKASTITQDRVFNVPVESLNGIYASVSGAGATFIIHYSLL